MDSFDISFGSAILYISRKFVLSRNSGHIITARYNALKFKLAQKSVIIRNNPAHCDLFSRRNHSAFNDKILNDTGLLDIGKKSHI